MPTSSDATSISVRGLSKDYRIAHQNHKPTTLAEALVYRIRKPLAQPLIEVFCALNDVSFDVEAGEVLGIIGRNGAGKSTLLKVLSRITSPTRGEVRLRGRMASLLEVGTGFHPELTGRENIFLNGAILGMRHREIDRQFEAIVEFAEVERFLDTPVKRYSSGMYVRLAFAVAAHLNPEILVVDEVLAVGDAAFQKKCLGKMKDVSKESGRTVLFVSHNMAAIETLCHRALLLKAGSVEYHGDTPTAVARYATSILTDEPSATLPPARPGSPVRFVSYRFTQPDLLTPPAAGKELVGSFEVQSDEESTSFTVEMIAYMPSGQRLFILNSQLQGATLLMKRGPNRVSFAVPRCQLVPGLYDVEIQLMRGQSGGGWDHLHVVRITNGLSIDSGPFYPTGANLEAKWAGVVQFESKWEVT